MRVLFLFSIISCIRGTQAANGQLDKTLLKKLLAQHSEKFPGKQPDSHFLENLLAQYPPKETGRAGVSKRNEMKERPAEPSFLRKLQDITFQDGVAGCSSHYDCKADEYLDANGETTLLKTTTITHTHTRTYTYIHTYIHTYKQTLSLSLFLYLSRSLSLYQH